MKEDLKTYLERVISSGDSYLVTDKSNVMYYKDGIFVNKIPNQNMFKKIYEFIKDKVSEMKYKLNITKGANGWLFSFDDKDEQKKIFKFVVNFVKEMEG